VVEAVHGDRNQRLQGQDNVPVLAVVDNRQEVGIPEEAYQEAGVAEEAFQVAEVVEEGPTSLLKRKSTGRYCSRVQ